MKNKPQIIILGCDFGTGVCASAKMAIKAVEEMPTTIVYADEVNEVINTRNYKGNPFDKPPIKLKDVPIIEFKPMIEPKHFDDPKSKYINKPIRNFRR